MIRYLILWVALFSRLSVCAADNPVPIAHRGLLRHAPENTLPAFAACIELGMGFELDVRTTKDGHLVVIHDDNVERTTDGPSRSVREMTLEELKRLDAGSWFDEAFKGVRVPTLEETLALVSQRRRGPIIIALNVKDVTAAGESQLVALVVKYKLLSESFAFDQNKGMSRRLKKLNPAFRIGQNVARKDIDARLREGLVDCFLLTAIPTAVEVARLHKHGKQVLFNYAGAGKTRRNPGSWRRAAAAGVDGLLTDYPLECRGVWRAARPGNADAPISVDQALLEIVIRGGTVIDGTGRDGFKADVAIRGGRIVQVGRITNTARIEIDAKDLVVCPGFIDLHSHADRGILNHRAAENYIRQGVTTLVCGNCGGSPVNIGEFFSRLREKGSGPNVAMLIGHGSVRQKVIGRLNVPPNPAQLDQMKRLVAKAMSDGAVGMSTSLRYGPGAYARSDEIVALAKELKSFEGIYATHMRDEGTRILAAIDEALRIGREAEIPVHISHHKISSASAFGLTRRTLLEINRARSAGLDVTLDQYPYGAGSGGLSLYVPQASLSGGLPAYRQRIANPKQRAGIVAGVEELLLRKIYETSQSHKNPLDTRQALARIQIARATHDSTLEGLNLVQILTRRKQKVTLRNGAELLVELVGQGVRGINHTLDARPGDVDRVMKHPLTAVASDGSVFKFGEGNPHPRSYGCFPRVLGKYVRERKVLKLEVAIRKMTQLPASRLRWSDRGQIKANSWADVVVFDPRTVADRATFLKPHQHSKGIRDVIVRGQFVLRDGRMTGRLPGRPVHLGPLRP